MIADNPYAAPSVDLEAIAELPLSDLTDLSDARRRLVMHLQDPESLALDKAAIGRRFRTGTLVSVGLIVLGLALIAVHAALAVLAAVGFMLLLIFGIRDLMVGIVAGGLAYVPFCLWEMRMSPMLGWKNSGG